MLEFVSTLGKRMQAFLQAFLALLLGTMILDVLLGVVSRYFFGSQVEWTEELACYLLVWIGLTGAAAAFAQNAHLGLDVLVSYFDLSGKRKATLISCLICLSFTILVFLIGGTALTIQAFQINRILPALQISDGFVFLALPVSGLFMLIFQLETLLKTLFETIAPQAPSKDEQNGFEKDRMEGFIE